MQPRKAAKSRHKLSFAVDRAEIDISSDWVQAVMQKPSLPSRAESAKALVVDQSATVADESTVAEEATVAKNATDALFGGSYVATVADNATANDRLGADGGIAINTTVALDPTVEASDTVLGSTVEPSSTVENSASVELDTTVVNNATVAYSSTVAVPSRAYRLRPIRRITDGLTPGQYAVYSLMFERGEAQPGQGSRLFRGGYIDLVNLTGLSKRGIQNVVGDLQKKFVISIHQAPGYHRSQSTVYLVSAEELVLKRWFDQGLCYSMGKSKDLVNIATVANDATV